MHGGQIGRVSTGISGHVAATDNGTVGRGFLDNRILRGAIYRL